MELSQILSNEISSNESTEPNVLIFVDEASMFWVTNDGYYVWLQDHAGINDYIDETHEVEPIRPTDKNIEGVVNKGIYWMNQDFENPFHISDFTKRISEINSIV